MVKDGSTNEPIACTNIFTENGAFKVNAEPNGSFVIPNEFLYEVFVFDAVGYEQKQQLLTDGVLLEHIENESYPLIMCELTLTN